MKTDVLLVITGIEILLFTILAFINSLPPMYPQVDFEVAVILVGFAAKVAIERPFTFLNQYNP